MSDRMSTLCIRNGSLPCKKAAACLIPHRYRADNTRSSEIWILDTEIIVGCQEVDDLVSQMMNVDGYLVKADIFQI